MSARRCRRCGEPGHYAKSCCAVGVPRRPTSGKRTAKSSPRFSDKIARPFFIIAISLYEDNLRALNALVKALKGRGFTHASRSSVIRAGIAGLDVEAALEALRKLPEFTR